MQFFSSLILTVVGFTSFATANEAESDIVACAFNNFRVRNGIEPIKIAELLVRTSDVQARHMLDTRSLTTTGIEGGSVADRIEEVGYRWNFAYSLVGQGYRNTLDFADGMIRLHGKEILQKEIKHIGVGRARNYWDIDFGNTKAGVRIRQPKCV